MNSDLVENILTHSSVKGAPRMVLVALAFLAGADRVADVTHDQIRKAAGTTAVATPLRKLEELGAIIVGVHQGRQTPKGRANLYKISRWGDQTITPDPEESSAGVIKRSRDLFNNYIDLTLETLEKEKRLPDQTITPAYIFGLLIEKCFDIQGDRALVDLTATLIRRYGTPTVKTAIGIAVQNDVLRITYVASVAKNISAKKPNGKLQVGAAKSAPDDRSYVVTGESDTDVDPIWQYIESLLDQAGEVHQDGDSFHPRQVFEELGNQSDIASRVETQAIEAVNRWWVLMGLVGVDRVMQQLISVKVPYRKWQDMYLTFHVAQEHWS